MLLLGTLRLCSSGTGSPLLCADPDLIPILHVSKLIYEVPVNKPSVGSVGEPGHELLVDALIAAPPGDSGWQIPLDPLLNVSSDPKAWAPVMRQLIRRAL